MTISARPPVRPTSALADDDHERIVVRRDRATGTHMVVAVHSTVLGPALGGLRLKRYPGGLREAMADAMGLARTMTLKASAAGLALGGGKAVMIDDGAQHMRDARLEVAARTVNELAGDYVTAEDIGTTTADMDLMSRHTPYVVGRSLAGGGGGDPSPVTAETVFRSVGCGLREATGSGELEGRRVGIVGLGKVGYALGVKLAAGGADVIACDLEPERVERFVQEHGGQAAPSAEAVLALELDVISPCAAGGMIDDAMARSIDCRVVAGAANNPLASRDVARTLARRGILYVPDFLANCGGLIHVAAEWYGGDGPDESVLVDRAEESIERAIATAEAEGSTPLEVAERQALERVEAARA